MQIVMRTKKMISQYM